MSDLISRQDAIDAVAMNIPFITFTEDCKRTAQRIIGTVPSADRPTGEWVEEDEYGDLLVCSECGFANDYKDNYCPNCGAKMKGENK